MVAQRLTDASFRTGIDELCIIDPIFGRILETWGYPPLWTITPGYSGLVNVVLSQQVSLASAGAAFRRLKAAIQPISPQNFMALDDATLRQIGFSRQKAAYVRSISCYVLERNLDFCLIDAASDEAARESLQRLKGIGPWSADVYLLMALARPDVWPGGDLALAKAVREVRDAGRLQGRDELEAMARCWQPFRSVAARMLWHYYLSKRGQAGAVLSLSTSEAAPNS